MCQQAAATHWMRMSSTSCHACSAAARSACCACSTQARRRSLCLRAASRRTLKNGLHTAQRVTSHASPASCCDVLCLPAVDMVNVFLAQFCRHEWGDDAAPVRLCGFAGRQCTASGPEAGPCSRWRPHRRLRVGTPATHAGGTAPAALKCVTTAEHAKHAKRASHVTTSILFAVTSWRGCGLALVPAVCIAPHHSDCLLQARTSLEVLCIWGLSAEQQAALQDDWATARGTVLEREGIDGDGCRLWIR